MLFNSEDFPTLVSRTLEVILENIGEAEILVTRGNETAITYEGIFLPVNFKGENPYVRDGYAVYKDENENVWLGVEIE